MQPPKPPGNPIARVAKAIGPVRGLLGLLVAFGLIGYIAVPSIQGTVNGIISNPTGIVDQIRKLVAPTLEPVRPVIDHRLIGRQRTTPRSSPSTPSPTPTGR